MSEPAIIWFRRDLRRRDNPALFKAYDEGRPILPVFILDDENAGYQAPGAASRWWLHHSLKSLDKSLSGHLVMLKGKADELIPDLLEQTGIRTIYWNRGYEPWRKKVDTKIMKILRDADIHARTFNGTLLYKPSQTLKKDGDPYSVFTHFYRTGCLKNNGPPAKPLDAPERLTYADTNTNSLSLEDLDLLPDRDWGEKISKHWTPGEDKAHERLDEFLKDGLKKYDDHRNRPDLKNSTSRLSPYLHFGEISPKDVWHAVDIKMRQAGWEESCDTFCSEIGWREFNYNLLHHHKDLPQTPLREKFSDFPWRNGDDYKSDFEKWKKGQTGYPMVDAGMRQLWETGWMHNRVRMIVGSFLVKDLLIPWQDGERWFWDCLVDADPASNTGNWQWVAGCGADAAPFFRVFNPTLQGERFDPEGAYIRAWVPELKNVPDKYIHEPSQMPDDVQKDCSCVIGEDYPSPIVDHKEARERALEAYEKIK